ncbi:MAG: transposase [archaeon]|nr:transposase [archaeon]
MAIITPKKRKIMDIIDFFQAPKSIMHKQYEALRAFYVDKKSAITIAKEFGYSVASVYSLTRDFKKRMHNEDMTSYFFNKALLGRKVSSNHDELSELIILLRKKNLSVPDIKAILDTKNKIISERHIYNVLHKEGFARLPRRNKIEKQTSILPNTIIKAEKTRLLKPTTEEFSSVDAGLLIFLPFIKTYDIDRLINNSKYPGTMHMPKLNSILAFLGLKLSNINRYTSDDLWCMDRGLGLFAGVNVLPKSGWFTSYSNRISRNNNLAFLKEMNELWLKHGLLSDTVNLDFVTIPYWGEEEHLENNWSGTRHKALNSILAAVAQDPDTGIITYGDANVRHDKESNVAVEFLDFYKKGSKQDIKYLVFDSKFTTYENLSKLDDNNVKFVTIRRRGKKIVNDIEVLSKSEWKKIRVPMSKGKTRQVKINDQIINIKKYGKKIRQIAITGHGKIKPALIITNDFDINQADIIRKYARRWLVEKTISEQTHFFHLNKLSSSMVVKVDFDLTMTILAHNLYRLLANSLPGFTLNTAKSLYEKFIHNDSKILCDEKEILVQLKKKRRSPALMESLGQYLPTKIPWLNDRIFKIESATTT